MRIFFFCLFIIVSKISICQIDSAMNLINKENDNVKKIEIAHAVIEKIAKPQDKFFLSQFSFQKSNELSNTDLLAKSALLLGKSYFELNQNDSALYYFDFAEKKYKSNDNKEGLFDVYYGKSEYWRRKNVLEKALEYSSKLIDLAEHLDNPDKIGGAYFKMGMLFDAINDFEKQILYFNKALKLFLKTNNILKAEACYITLGNCYIAKNYYDFAIEYFERGLEINQKTKNCINKSSLLSGIGHVYFNLTNNEKALSYFKDALSIQSHCENANNLYLKNNIAVALMDLERYTEAKPYLIEFYFNTDRPRDKADAAFNLAQTYEQLGDYNTAMDYMDIYVRLNDSINEAINAKNLSEIEAKYRNEKQEEQNIFLKERVKNKNRQIYFALGGILLLAGMLFFIFRGLKQKQKANLALEEKNKIIEEKNVIVEEQHKDITDSIKYAERIQQAILPPNGLWQSILPHSFVYYQPKDILSGDFYWIEETPTHIFVAAADCTGHGVPGALMSIVNYNLLNKAVLEQGLTDAGKILDGVNKWLTDSLHQTFQESTVRDGMDVSLCVLHKENRTLNYAGAFNPIYVVRHGEIKVLTTDKHPVGAFIEDHIKSFTSKEITLMENDIVYLFTDGFADQFGGENGKKFKYKNLQQLLLEIHSLPFPDQKRLASSAINNWKGYLEQVDDILLLGFRL